MHVNIPPDMTERNQGRVAMLWEQARGGIDSRLSSFADGVNHLLERCIAIFPEEDPNLIARLTGQLDDRTQIFIDVKQERAMGTMSPVIGVLVRMVQISSVGEYEDIFYSLNDKGDSFWHIQRTPWFGDVLETADTSLARLEPFKDDIFKAIEFHKKPRSILQQGFQNFQRAA